MAKATTWMTCTAGLCGLVLGIAAQARAEEGNAVVESKTDSQVVMGAKTYSVGLATVIESKDGNRIPLAELPTLGGGASADDAAVWFEASDAETAPVAYRIKLTGGVPD